MPSVTVQELKAKLDAKESFRILDVREPQEWQICHLDQAKLMPLGELASRVHELDSAQEYVVHCKLGGRSAKAVAFLREAGFAKVYNLTGGIKAWAERIDETMVRY